MKTLAHHHHIKIGPVTTDLSHHVVLRFFYSIANFFASLKSKLKSFDADRP
jgi:hypothetical protein